MHDILCVIPARGGSRGIPAKNLHPVGGVPLVARAVDTALESASVTRVVVSTDHDEIAAWATRRGAEVLRRPPELAGDTASSESALLHAVQVLADREGYVPEVVVLVQCTSPFTIAGDIDGVVRAVVEGGADCALTVALSHRFLWRLGPDGSAEGVNHSADRRLRRQDRPPEWLETGAAYAMRTDGLKATGHRFFGRIGIHEQDPSRYLEIDDPGDLVQARAMAPFLDRRRFGEVLPRPLGALVLDFDGVLTDNSVSVSEDGRETVRCHRGDGLGISRLHARGVPILVLSKERNPVVTARCEKLGVPCIQGVDDKLAVLESWASERDVPLGQIVFVGNDVNDAVCLEAVGCGAVVADAHPAVLSLARIRLHTPGGHGAVRELTDLIEAHLDERGTS